MNVFQIYGNHMLHFYYVKFRGIEPASSITQWLEHPTGHMELVVSIPICNSEIFSVALSPNAN